MNSNYLRKQEIYNELSRLVGIKRKNEGNTLSTFISIYLKSLTPYKRPSFHKAILGQLQQVAIADISLGTNTAQEGSEGVKNTDKGEGMTPYTPTLKNHLITSPHNSTQNNNSLLDNKGGDKSTQTPVKKLSPSSKYNRLLFIAPRGFAKSTICSRFFPLWLALYGKKSDILLISSTVALAKDNLRIIKDQIASNDKLINDFGDMKSDKWTEEEIVLTNGTRIRAKGRGFQIRGLRPDIIICDDLEDDDIVASKEQREKLENWFLRTLLPTLKPDQHLVYIGTKLHQFALISKLQEKAEFRSYHYKALVDGKSIWEDMWPVKRLLELKEEIGVYAFESEYQNNPLSLTEQPIKPHFIDGVRSDGQIVESCMSIDPAISERENADFTAIQIMGKTERGEFRELLTVKGRWGIDEQVDKVIDLYVKYNKEWNILRVLLEEVAYQKVLRPILTKKARSKDIYLPVSTAELGMGGNKRPKDKRTRLMQIVHLFEARLVEVTNPDTKIELLSFPFGDYDDMVDVTVYNLYWLINNRPGKYMLKKEERGLPFKTQESFYVDEPRPGVFVAKAGGPPFKLQPKLFINYDK